MSEEEHDQLAKALVKFRAECPTIKFDSKNPFFTSKFASLAAIHEVVDPILAEHGLVVMQFPVNSAGGGGAGCRTIVMHESGQYIEQEFIVPLAKSDPQGACSAVSYARRYGISGALGLVTEEDDDGESSMDRKPKKPKPAVSRSTTIDGAHADAASAKKARADAADKWSGVFVSLTGDIAGCKDRDALKVFFKDPTNQKALKQLEERAPSVYEDVMKAFHARAAEFKQENE